jgi:hypothetical protein
VRGVACACAVLRVACVCGGACGAWRHAV